MFSSGRLVNEKLVNHQSRMYHMTFFRQGLIVVIWRVGTSSCVVKCVLTVKFEIFRGNAGTKLLLSSLSQRVIKQQWMITFVVKASPRGWFFATACSLNNRRLGNYFYRSHQFVCFFPTLAPTVSRWKREAAQTPASYISYKSGSVSALAAVEPGRCNRQAGRQAGKVGVINQALLLCLHNKWDMWGFDWEEMKLWGNQHWVCK